MFDPVINALPAFASFFATAIGLLGGFLALYVLVTPYNELALIRSGNTAAAVSLGGALLGFAMPIAVSVAVSHNLYAMIGWGVVAGALQLLTYVLPDWPCRRSTRIFKKANSPRASFSPRFPSAPAS
jgi:putative membrane protein